MKDCIQLTQYSAEQDEDDIPHFYDAVLGKLSHQGPTTENLFTTDRVLDKNSTLETVLSEISQETLAAKVGFPIDTARAGFVLESVTVESNEEFNEIISAFYFHLLRHSRTVTTATNSMADALSLLDRAFSNQGGTTAALAEAKNPTQGGMRYILDVLTEQFKSEEQEKHIHRIFKEAIDPLNWDQKVEFIKTFLERMAPQLPDEIRQAPPERYARHWEQIARVYERSFDRFNRFIRSM